MRPAWAERLFWTAHSRNWDDSLVDGDVVGAIAATTAELAALLRPSASVVDLGCGTGNHAIALAQHGFAVTAVDFTTAMLTATESKAAANQLPIRIHQADLSRPLPFDDASFDGAISIYAAQFLDLDQLLAEIHRIIAPGGALLIEAPRPDSTRRDLRHLSRRYRWFQRVKHQVARVGTAAGLVHLHTPEHLASAAERAGFTEITTRTTANSTIVTARR